MRIRTREEIRAMLEKVSAENCAKIEKHLLTGCEVEIEYNYGDAEDVEMDAVCFQGSDIGTIEAAKKFYKSNRVQKIHCLGL